MGSVSVRPELANRALTVSATELPRGAVVLIVQGPVDDGSAVDSGAAVVAQVSKAPLRTGTATVDTTSSSFVRAEVWTSNGRLVAFTNPIWLPKETPPVAPSPARQAPDSTA